MSATWPVTQGVFLLGDLEVELGGTIKDAQLTWQVHGTLNEARDNVIVYPCSYTATHDDLAWLIGPGKVLDPTEWFIIVPDMFANGVSSSPSQPSNHDDYPGAVTMADNVRAQYRLVTEHFGVTRVAATYGFSMGAGQAYHWAALFPDFVERAIIVCGSSRTSIHNRVFLSGLLRILEAAPQYEGGGRFSSEPTLALTAFGHVYAGWGLSQDFYRERLFETALGAPDLETFLHTDWAESFAQIRAADLYASAVTWQEADISRGAMYDGDLAAALAGIQARVLLMPSETDLYFRVADNEAELEHLRHGTLAVIPSIWGHRAGSPEGIPDDLAFLTRHVREWLAS